MNPDVKAKWVARLRELPNDMQGAGVLKDDRGRMCCLGVLCEIAVEEGVLPSNVDITGNTVYGDTDYKYMPVEVSTWAGFEGVHNPRTEIGSIMYGHSTLASLNDSTLADFDDIADLIDKEF